MRDLNEIRQDINKVDDELKKLFLQRMENVQQVAEFKKATNTPVKNKDREADIINNKLKGVDKFTNETHEFFKSLFEISCNYQERFLSSNTYNKAFTKVNNSEFLSEVNKVSHQGLRGSYSYEIAAKYFESKNIISLESFRDVFESVVRGDVDLGILPLENLCLGSVSDVYDLLTEYDVCITHCCSLEIDHCLAGCGKLSDVSNVISHPQALGQCSKYLDNKNLNKQVCSNTAVASMMVAERQNNNLAAICSKKCAELYSLKVLDENISDIDNNVTRFIFITKNPTMVNDADKASIIFTLKHETGTLSRIMNNFAKNEINLTKIESRPSKNDDWEYVFYADLMLPEFDIIEYFSKIRYMFNDFKIAGIYKNLG